MNKDRLMQNIKSARNNAGMTQKSLADILGISFQGIAKWELGYRTPKLENIEKIAKACNVLPIDLLSGVFDD